MYQHDNRLAYAELKRRAIHGIENGDVLQRANGLKRSVALHLFTKGRYPRSFQSWTVYRHNHTKARISISNSSYSVIKADWNWEVDMKRAEQTPPSDFKPEPTWIIKQAPLENEALEAYLQEASTIAIPVAGISGHAGKDGADCGLKWYSNSTGVSLYFWSNGPKEWDALVDWTQKLIHYLDDELWKAARRRRQNIT
ncbi:MAG: hypothetical protein ABI690_19280 [Chloroflexota bacterium]